MNKLYFSTIILFLFISCSSNNKDTNDTRYDKFISELDRIEVTDSTRIKYNNSSVYKPFQLAVTEKGQVIVIDAANYTLHLMDQKGNFNNSVGGFGKGPNEYQLINQIFMGADNQLYVYDARSEDITIYSIANNEFELQDDIALPSYIDEKLNLQKIYKITSGYVGVFKKLTGPAGKEENFQVYRLGEDLQLQSHLFDMPANETYLTQGFRKSNPVGYKTFWDMTGGSFFYTTSNNLSVSSVNIQNDSIKKYKITDVPKPIKGEEEIAAMESRLRPLIHRDPKLKELINDGEYLPYYIYFLPGEDFFYYTLFRPGKENGIILRVDKVTKEIKKIVVPTIFNLYAVHENTLFGIDHTKDGANEILFLKLES